MEKRKKKKEKEKTVTRQHKINVTTTIRYLEKIIKEFKENPIDNFLQNEIFRLKKEQKEWRK